ncbi:MAG: GntR family transcriptional regulator, partial [Lachnospiraceae bacterium]|nr:GntR family transcriptional regulator [Lachnospiraceae bacterium]
MKIIISNQSELPIYAQIREQIKEQILNGQIDAGTILPSIRKLAKETGVSVITTTRAYNDLEEQGFIASMQGRG